MAVNAMRLEAPCKQRTQVPIRLAQTFAENIEQFLQSPTAKLGMAVEVTRKRLRVERKQIPRLDGYSEAKRGPA